MAFLRIVDLTKAYRETVAVDRVNLNVDRGELFTLLGPSGCGKSTTLRMVAGLELPDEGEIALGDEILTSTSKGIMVPPWRRDMGLVPQTSALWPHMNVKENIEFGLKYRRIGSGERRRRVKEVLELVGLSGFERRYPDQLSGGQQQRVALARALVIEPEVLLFDEPLSNLDARLRISMRYEIKTLQRRLGVTALYVTHDQAEAMVLSDRVAVMSKGRIQQVGTPREIYESPKNYFVADFVLTNIIEGRIVERHGGLILVEVDGFRFQCLSGAHVEGKALLTIRPEKIELSRESAPRPNAISGIIKDATDLGSAIEYIVECSGFVVKVQASPLSGFKLGEKVYVRLPPEHLNLIPGGE